MVDAGSDHRAMISYCGEHRTIARAKMAACGGVHLKNKRGRDGETDRERERGIHASVKSICMCLSSHGSSLLYFGGRVFLKGLAKRFF